jgi:predicted acetyltransferase
MPFRVAADARNAQQRAAASREHRRVQTTVRAISAEEIPAFVRADAAGFGENEKFAEEAPRWIADELDRTRAAFDGDELVATSRNYTFELTLPGGQLVPAPGVSAVAVLPTHRRQGILTAMMTALLDDAVERTEPVAMLTASEGGIYGRFGFGVTSHAAQVDFDVRNVEFAPPRPGGRLRLVAPEELRKQAPALFDRVRRVYPGAISRSEIWWTDVQFDRQLGNRFDVLYESPSGAVDGFVTYAIKDRWSHDPSHRLFVRDMVAATPEATHAMWRYLCEIDLVRNVTAHRVPLDSPLQWLLRSLRVGGPTRVDDYVWTRVLDVPATLGNRTYAVPGRLVLEVHDPSRPGSAADGTFVVEGGPDGAEVGPTQDAPDLVCDVHALSTFWLGGTRASTLAGAGWIDERTPGALATADAMFASTPLPFPFTWF